MASATKLFLALPVAHIVICYIHLYFFQLGFGGNIEGFFSVSDIFSQTISGVIPFYITVGGGALIGYLFFTDRPLEVVDKLSISLHPSARGLLMTAAMWFALPIFSTIGFLYALIFHGKFIILLLAFFASPIVGIFSAKFVSINRLSPLWHVAIFWVILGTALASGLAYKDGFRLRHDNYDILANEFPKCKNDSLVLFTAGEFFITAGEQGHRYITDADCKPLARMDKQTVKIDIL